MELLLLSRYPKEIYQIFPEPVMLIEFPDGEQNHHVMSYAIGNRDTVKRSTTGMTDKAKLLKQKAYDSLQQNY